MSKWFALNNEGGMVALGEHEDSESADWALAEANGEGVFIEFVAASDTPIEVL